DFCVKRAWRHSGAYSCMPLKFNRRVSDWFRGGLLWFLSWFRQERAERVSGGAGNGCYGKFLGA
ncbi:hypothetical protein, partial [Enterobacter kobei]|uniref:hypothetical protein n=1 Tax=Enterobacter kobei TaxID=208224 RepID=UPI0032AE9C4C